MNKLIKGVIGVSLKYKYFTFFLVGLLAIAGIISFKNTPIDAFPDVTNTSVTIISQWPGRSAEEVEKFVTIPIEIALNAAQEKAHIRSTSIFGLSTVKVTFDDHVTDKDARIQINNLIGNADLPNGVKPDIQPPTGPTGEIFRYTLKSNVYGPMELKTIQDWIVDRELRSVPGVADVTAFGGMVKTFEIQVQPEKIKSLGINLLDVYDAVANSNINIGGDMIEKNDQAYVVRGIGLLNSIDEIKNVTVTNINGVPVVIGDIADVVVSHLPRLGTVGRTDAIDSVGKRLGTTNNDDVVEGIVLMRRGENPEAVIPLLKSKIEELNSKKLPAGVKINPFYDREDLVNLATHTVLHNLIEGMLLVTIIVSLFMFNWRTTLIVSIIIPLSLLFAFICLRLMGMPANLLSMGAIDFGIIIDGAVVMVEGLFVIMDHQARTMGMERFNKLAKMSLIKKKGAKLGKAIFFSKLIIITALLPIFAFQKVEGKMFSPLAYTLGFALVGALIFTLTLVPVMVSVLLNKNVRERHNPIVHTLTSGVMHAFKFTFKNRRLTFILSAIIMVVGLFSFKFLGTEFMPELNEGSLWIRASLPYSVALGKSKTVADEIRQKLLTFPEVKKVVSQTGRPDDGTDVTGFYNIECDVALYSQHDWPSGVTLDKLIDSLHKSLSVIPGIELNFSQPIMDNVEEAVSGVKGSIVAKIYGDSLPYMEAECEKIAAMLKTVPGIADVGAIKNIGQPQLQIDLDQTKMAIYGITTAQANAVIETAIGGKAATELYQGIRKFDIRIRFPESYRNDIEKISNVMVPSMSGVQIPLHEIANLKTIIGPTLIFRDDHERYAAVKFSVRGRDMGSAIEEARAKVGKQIHLNKDYDLVWQGDFENQQRAQHRLAQVVPISLLLIFLLLFVMFGSFKDAGLVFLNVPFALVGGIFMLLLTGTNFSISAGIGFIALFGICILEGVLLISAFKDNLEHKVNGQRLPLGEAVHKGVHILTRPVLMTALMAIIGLLPAAMATGIGSESARPLARVVIGGLICATIFSLLVFPVIFNSAYKKSYHSHPGNGAGKNKQKRKDKGENADEGRKGMDFPDTSN